MRFSVIDFVAAGKFGASSETWRSTAFCTAILRQSREKCFTLLTGNRARNRCDPGENAFHFRYQIFFTLRRDGERQEHEQACWYESVLIIDVNHGVWYSHWLESGAPLLSRERSSQGSHRLYGSWNADALQLTWIAEDGDWDVHGDPWVYFDTQPSGTTTADQPSYPAQGGQNVVAVTLPFAADYAIHVRDGNTAVIRQWNGSAWITSTQMSTTVRPTPSGPPVYRLVSDQIPRRTDLYIPLGYLGTSAANPLRLAAFVANEAYSSGSLPCLLVGAPDLNPLNCAADLHPLARTGDIHALALTQFLTFESLPAHALPNAGRYGGTVPAVDVQVWPRGAVVGYLQSDRYDVLTPGQPIDANLDGVIDHPLNVTSGLVGNGQTVTYTVAVRNSGDGAMPGVVVTATARGALQLTGPASLALGSIPPGSVVTATFTAQGNTALNPNAAELMLALDDATHQPFEWFWVHHAVDSTPPQAPRIAEPLSASSQLEWAFIQPLTNTVSGWVYSMIRTWPGCNWKRSRCRRAARAPLTARIAAVTPGCAPGMPGRAARSTACGRAPRTGRTTGAPAASRSPSPWTSPCRRSRWMPTAKRFWPTTPSAG
jgi:hypothetical protein